jgi:hypothetical protein
LQFGNEAATETQRANLYRSSSLEVKGGRGEQARSAARPRTSGNSQSENRDGWELQAAALRKRLASLAGSEECSLGGHNWKIEINSRSVERQAIAEHPQQMYFNLGPETFHCVLDCERAEEERTNPCACRA